MTKPRPPVEHQRCEVEIDEQSGDYQHHQADRECFCHDPRRHFRLGSTAISTAERPTALYPRLLGAAWRDLHPAIRRLHLTDDAATGRFAFHRGRGLEARLTCWVLRLPSSAAALEVRLAIARDAESETWARTFGRRRLVTIQRALPDGRLAERFGALELRFHLRVLEGALTYVQAGAGIVVGRLLIPLPRWIAPRVEAREACGVGRGSHIRVGISAPGIGLVMAYEGCIQVERP